MFFQWAINPILSDISPKANSLLSKELTISSEELVSPLSIFTHPIKSNSGNSTEEISEEFRGFE